MGKAAIVAVLTIFVSHAHAASAVTGTLTITVQPPLVLVFNPANPSIACSAAAGTVVTGITVAGGDGNQASLTATGDTTDFALSATTTPANLIVGTNGIAAADCGKSNNVTITATQN